ncbi:MFS transporter [Actinokineospora terrae]|uniref:Major Facilitator Superfamily protein n=1 Tax=Actinokineospora terrae TaxID=155974 RepID=A0A1H9NSJ4_9PSEU|nr:MFS transporter [Actinokineospora terrae]SER38737.1 Major Facilitator Superfamily protein [Actinokineospora terrae]
MSTSNRLWTPTFALYFTARIVSMLGDMMIPVAMSVAVLGLGYGVTGVGLALGAWMGAFALCVVFGGVVADRFHPLPQMVGADAVRCAVQAGLAVYLLLGHPPLSFVVGTSLLGGVATAMFQPGLTSMVPQVAADPHRANGVLRISQGLATMLGPALAGVLVATTSIGLAFAVDAATFAVSGICLLLVKVPRFEVTGTESTWHNLRAGWHEFRSRSWLWSVILIWWVLGVLVWGPIHPLGAASIIEVHGTAAFGYAEAAFGAGSVLGGLVAIRLRPARPLFSGGIAMFLFPLMPLAAALVPAVPVLLSLYAISGLGWAFWGVQWATAVQTQVPQDKLNRVAAYEVAGSILAVPLGQVLAGPASTTFGVHPLLFVAAIAGTGCAIALVTTAPIRRLTRV